MKKTIKIILVLAPLITVFVVAYFRSNWVDKELKKNGKITIGRIDSIERLPKWSIIYLSYYINNKKYVFSQDDLDTGITRDDLLKFYEVRYLPSSPEIIRGDYSKQITDTTAILKAGFLREEIANMGDVSD